MERTYDVVGASTGRPCAARAAAVVLDAHGLENRGMQAIAVEFNLSETTLAQRQEDGVYEVHIGGQG